MGVAELGIACAHPPTQSLSRARKELLSYNRRAVPLGPRGFLLPKPASEVKEQNDDASPDLSCNCGCIWTSDFVHRIRRCPAELHAPVVCTASDQSGDG